MKNYLLPKLKPAAKYEWDAVSELQHLYGEHVIKQIKSTVYILIIATLIGLSMALGFLVYQQIPDPALVKRAAEFATPGNHKLLQEAGNVGRQLEILLKQVDEIALIQTKSSAAYYERIDTLEREVVRLKNWVAEVEAAVEQLKRK